MFDRFSVPVCARAISSLLTTFPHNKTKSLAPPLFDEDDKEVAQQLRESIVAPAQRSPKAKKKASTKRSETGHPVHSFQTLLKDLQTVAKNRVTFHKTSFDKTTTPTDLQQMAFALLGVPYRL